MKLRYWLAPMALLSVSACARPGWQTAPHDAQYQKSAEPRLHKKPSELRTPGWYESFYHSSFAQFGRVVSPGHYLQKQGGGHDALDVNAFGQVPDSTWFENRIGRRDMTPQEVFRGSLGLEGPAPGMLRVESIKSKGITPGLNLIDSAGQRWIAKFDHPAHPELGSGAEVVTSRLLWAAGYHVPENYVVRFHIERIHFGAGATATDKYDRKVTLTQARLDRLLKQLNPLPDGRIRAMFSRFLPGEPVGPFPLVGVRHDDPNDRIPHERRRTLRGLRLFYAWLNNTDATSGNSLDMFMRHARNRQVGHLKHFLLDFGSALGATALGPKPLGEGYRHTFDWESIGRRYVGAGFYYPYWVTLRRNPFLSVGSIESEVFDPARWRPQYPNPSFEMADAGDLFWAGAILAKIRPVHVAAAVRAGEYTEEGAADFLTRVLIERQKKALTFAFERMLPLDDPRVEHGQRVVMTDLARRAGLRGDTPHRYRLDWHRGNSQVRVSVGTRSQPRVHLRAVLARLAEEHPDELERHPFLTLTWLPVGSERPRVHLRMRRRPDGRLLPVAIDRVERAPR